jgi:hypothetical protein
MSNDKLLSKGQFSGMIVGLAFFASNLIFAWRNFSKHVH